MLIIYFVYSNLFKIIMMRYFTFFFHTVFEIGVCFTLMVHLSFDQPRFKCFMKLSDYRTGRCTSSFFCLRSWMVKSKEKQGHVLKGAGSSEGFI